MDWLDNWQLPTPAERIAIRRPVAFGSPAETLGFDGASSRRAGFTTNASGTIRVAGAPDTTFMLMLHLGRHTPAGMELFSHYWIGAHPELVQSRGDTNGPALLSRMGMETEAVERLAYKMAAHDMTEFAQLGRILPDLFAAFGYT